MYYVEWAWLNGPAANFTLKLARPGFGPAAELPAFSPASRRPGASDNEGTVMKTLSELALSRAQPDFAKRHVGFFEGTHLLDSAAYAAFDRQLHDPSELDKVVFYLGLRVFDDFVAIAVLAAYDVGLSATALLRGMYERVVTAAYLREHPDKVGAFIDFDIVQSHRTLSRLNEVYDFDQSDKVMFDELSGWRAEVADQYAREKCPTCKKAPMLNWTTTDFISMAKSVPSLRDLLPFAYDVPLSQAHATLRSTTAMLKEEDGVVSLRADYANEAENALRLGHMLALHALNLQIEQFHDASVEKAVEEAAQHYLSVWPHGSARGA